MDWKKNSQGVVVAQFRVGYSQRHLLGRTETKHWKRIRIAGVLVGIRN